MDLAGFFTVAIVAQSIPVATGILIGYSIIAVVLGSLLRLGRVVSTELALTIMSSGLLTALLLICGVALVILLPRIE